ncbi:YD repeat-containing protein [Chryseobacterium defluvii]|uniref:YD repeat-containing protein n=1 Tax=Chryseobacterium defluvii TaxID=160396 RepID=A0A840KFY4_9FLAO|nr:hypothetical protein [Chryseobacterium defluvii]MBB4806443.1 YD repeat-containing protein [Chryseobacterium defluvii]
MMNLFKCFLALIFIALLSGCSNSGDVEMISENINNNSNPVNQAKYIKYYSVEGSTYGHWAYDSQNRLIEMTASGNKTSYTYDSQGRLIKAETYAETDPANKFIVYTLVYNQNMITIEQKINYSGVFLSEINDYIINSEGKPAKQLRHVNGGIEEMDFTYQNGNLIRKENSYLKYEYTYDNKKNVYYHYPIGFRLIMNDDFVSDNNITHMKSYAYGQFLEDIPFELTYDNDGYLLRIKNKYYTQNFSY